MKDPDESKRKLKLVTYEPWASDRTGNPEIPLWLAVDLARIEGRAVPDASWDETFGGDYKKMLKQLWDPWSDLLIAMQFQGQQLRGEGECSGLKTA
eukprot:jgi/Tetstr1/457229/TSEL_043877.t1